MSCRIYTEAELHLMPFCYGPRKAVTYTDAEIRRWLQLRATEWSAWPAFMSQLLIPVLLLRFPVPPLLLALALVDLLWRFISVSLLNVTLARISPFITWLKWPSAIVCTCFLVYSRRYGIAVLALVWPLAGVIVSLLGTAFSARLGVGTTGKIERALAARIGYPGASAQDGPLPHDLSESGHFGKPLSVVLVDDEEFLLDCLEVIIRSWFNNARLLRFKNGLEAWEELSRTEPDLLITDDNMPVLNGEGLCLRLLEKKVAYPIIVQSASAPTQEWVETCASRGLNVAFLAEPYDVESLRRKFLEAGLRVPN